MLWYRHSGRAPLVKTGIKICPALLKRHCSAENSLPCRSQKASLPTVRSLSLFYDSLQRDNLLDIMSMSMDLVVKDYERLSFGPGQRYGSKGCYIIQLGPGAEPALLPRSEWVIH